jgi:serine protease Do
MIAINTAIARVAPDGLPITSISFSLKSSVATQWLREQGLGRPTMSTTLAPNNQTPAAADLPAKPSSQPEAKAAQPKAAAPVTPPMKPAKMEPIPARPYNLDALINDRNKAEADLEGMISEMRGRMKER